MLDDSLLTWLNANANIDGAFFWDGAEQDDDLPFGILSLEGEDKTKTQTGTIGFNTASLELVCYGSNAKSARDLANQVRDEITDYTGAMGDITIQTVFITGEYSGREDPSDTYYRTLNLSITYNAA